MDYAVYPFKREKKYRLYVKFTDDEGNQKALSTGVTYPLDATNQQRKQAQQQAEKKAIDILMEHFEQQRILAEQPGQQEPMDLSDYLREYYFPHVASSNTNQLQRSPRALQADLRGSSP